MLKRFIQKPFISFYSCRLHSVIPNKKSEINLLGKSYQTDEYTNITKRVIDKMGWNLHNNINHPLGILSERIKRFFYENYRKQYRVGTPVFSIFDNISPIVTTKQNFDDLLIPLDHISRKPSDTYYINQNTLLRGHTSAHEADLIKYGLDGFIIIGDVYRRDEIDRTHYPAFHQVEGVRLYTKEEIRDIYKLTGKEREEVDLISTESLREKPDDRDKSRQEKHLRLLSKLLETELKDPLEKLVSHLFGNNINYRWVSAFFPWTHPSYELEIEVSPGVWMEMLGCGIVEQDMLEKCGVKDRIGIAFGLGLERWAMRLFDIPDIRLFWTKDEGFLSQFHGLTDIRKPIKYKPISSYPPCINDLSFWLPSSKNEHSSQPEASEYHHNDFYEVAGSVGGDMLERVKLLDEFVHPKTHRKSVTYRLYYRDMSRNLVQEEVNQIHTKIEEKVRQQLEGEVR